MPGSSSWAVVALAAFGFIGACGNTLDHGMRAQAAGASGAAGAPPLGGGSPSSSSDGAAAGSVSASEGGNGPSNAGAPAGASSYGGAAEGNSPDAGAAGESSGAAGGGGAGSSPSCPAQPTTFQLTCEDVVERWSPSYAFDSSQWLLDANAAELPLESGSLTFFNAYSTSDFPICGVVPIEVAGKQLLATPTMDSHYLISAEIAQFQATDVCGNQYVFAPSGPDCGSITANEEGSWLGACTKSCPGTCN
jgi:hypothetical protein